MSLLVVSKGFSLSSMSIVFVMYSVFVILFEVPSGMLADAKGRKTSFALGLLFSLLGTALLFSSSYLMLCLGFALNGVGRAFGSGSLDALCIEEGRSHGRSLEDMVLALDVNSSLSLSLGALGGGFLLNLGKEGPMLTYPVLAVRLALVVLALLLLLVLIAPEKREGSSSSDPMQLGLIKQAFRQAPFLLVYSTSVLLNGILLGSVENYWQPYLKSLLASDSLLWVLGVITSLLFAVGILGSLLGRVLMNHISPPLFYCCATALVFLLEFVQSTIHSPWLFALVFSLVYLVFGSASVVGQFLLNKAASDQVRSSMLSLSSFSLQAGGVFANASATLLFVFGGISLYWKAMALLGIVGISLLSKPLLQRSPRS